MQLPASAHASRPWRIHAIAHDFRLEDVWALPTPGEAGDFPRLVEMVSAMQPEEHGPAVVRALWALRWRLGALLGWDDERAGLGARVRSLRERLPADLRDTPVPAFADLPFSPLYVTGDEFAAEIANGTVHGVMHLGWVESEPGRWRGQMAVLVRPNGRFGRAYLQAIRPFRHVLVYPALLRALERQWARRPVAASR